MLASPFNTQEVELYTRPKPIDVQSIQKEQSQPSNRWLHTHNHHQKTNKKGNYGATL
ncbi:hypothetical protein CROQUDRAFT_384532 [Cronartium quercuum f. sp. fusiforme G11]|uniref:Uncharacterized protein n=1 Tax=Cronartium quercuum f. sp. fusiforme G11 TaxID=708437 RepID=A0A9P6NSB7_9BASI|nr:hypothetical protein CROQUDRAFT_384324 [Cronartium quercuum f. sp. fusiforme G11]KAG0148666.1 hypothetical protein CROQUDRAFT_384532 [Cronartium quercuum f. sp. fusiforme G11]